MARLPRLLLPGHATHVHVRGHNRQPVFVDDGDRQRYLDWLRDAAREFQVSVHAYVLLPDAVRLLVTPRTANALARLMQSLARRHTQAFNRAHDRSGTLWEGRYQSGLVDPERWLLPVMRLIELESVHAGLVLDPADDPWSSYRHHAGLAPAPWIADHPAYWALGNTPFERQSAYRALVEEGCGTRERLTMVDACAQGWALGSPDYLQSLARLSPRRARPLPRGRPRRAVDVGDRSEPGASEA